MITNTQQFTGNPRKQTQPRPTRNRAVDPVAAPAEMMILPLLKFYDDWHPKSGMSAPTDLSRHVTAHQATDAHYTTVNALVAVMLMTSLLAGFTDAMS